MKSKDDLENGPTSKPGEQRHPDSAWHGCRSDLTQHGMAVDLCSLYTVAAGLGGNLPFMSQGRTLAVC
jgi:hypothetical protein